MPGMVDMLGLGILLRWKDKATGEMRKAEKSLGSLGERADEVEKKTARLQASFAKLGKVGAGITAFGLSSPIFTGARPSDGFPRTRPSRAAAPSVWRRAPSLPCHSAPRLLRWAQRGQAWRSPRQAGREPQANAAARTSRAGTPAPALPVRPDGAQPVPR
jgi:hypothetical protein